MGSTPPRRFDPGDERLPEWEPRYDELLRQLDTCVEVSQAAQKMEEAFALFHEALCGGGGSKTFVYNGCSAVLGNKSACRDFIRDRIWEFIKFRARVAGQVERSILHIAIFELIVEDPVIPEDLRLFLDLLHDRRTLWVVEHAYWNAPEKLYEHLMLLGTG